MEKKKKGRGRPKGSTTKKTLQNQDVEDLWLIPNDRRVDLSEVNLASLKFPLRGVYMGFGKVTIYSIKEITPTTCIIDGSWLNESFFKGLMRVNLYDIEIKKP